MTFIQRRAGERGAPRDREWRFAAYLRLSKEDGDKPESDSIQNQEKIIQSHLRFLRQQGENIASVSVFSDDGYAGGSFDRPDYRRMIGEIETGAVNAVIFKDNSRLGRNYPELGRLMEDYFPGKGVRVISVLNNLDSFRDPRGYSSALVSFSNMVNDDYIRQLSIKIKCTLDMKREQGEFIGNYAPYGYVKSQEDRHRLAVDPEAAQVVRQIFQWYTEGLSAGGIVKRLNALGVPTPAAYKAAHGCRAFAARASGGWGLTTVNTILRDEVYIGNLVQGKSRSTSYRTKQMAPVDQEDWLVTEGAHEAIISEEQFALVHQRLAGHARTAPKQDAVHLFSGLVRCGSCGRQMTRVTSGGVARYRCPTRTYAPDRCQCPSVREDHLTAVVQAALMDQMAALVDPAALSATRSKKPPGDDGYQTALRQAERERQRLLDAKFRLYDALQRGAIDQAEYELFHKRYGEKIGAQEARIEQLKRGLTELSQLGARDNTLQEFLQTESGSLPLDRALVFTLVDHIEVVSPERLELYFRFSDAAQRAPASIDDPASACAKDRRS